MQEHIQAPDERLPTLESCDVRALADLGFIALSRGLDHHAMAIFEGVNVARPEQETGALGIALVHLLRGDIGTATTMLRRLGHSDAVQAFLGMALARQGANDEARDVLDGVVRYAADTSYGNLAKEVLASLPPQA